LPFTALLTVFFSVVAVIIDQQLFKPVIQWVLAAKPEDQLALFYLANGLLSMVSDNVFVGTVYINEVKTALINGAISREHLICWPWPSTPAPTCRRSPPQWPGRIPVHAHLGSLPCCASLMAAWSGWRCPIPWCWGWWLFLRGTAPRSCNRMVLSGRVVADHGARHCPPRPIMKGAVRPLSSDLCSNSATIFSERSIR
jgi:hypothetical protein